MYPLTCTPNICLPIHITFFSFHFFMVAGDPNKTYTCLQYTSKTKLVFFLPIDPKRPQMMDVQYWCQGKEN